MEIFTVNILVDKILPGKTQESLGCELISPSDPARRWMDNCALV